RNLTGLIERSYRGRFTASVRDAIECAVRSGREDDHAVPIPRPASANQHRAKCLSGAARNVNLLELAAREKAYEAAVGRPEGITGLVCFRQRQGGDRIERANPELFFARRISSNEGKAAAIGRNSEAAGDGAQIRRRH